MMCSRPSVAVSFTRVEAANCGLKLSPKMFVSVLNLSTDLPTHSLNSVVWELFTERLHFC